MATVPGSAQEPNPAIIFDTINAYQRSAALKAALELDIFTPIGRGNSTVRQIAGSIGASERGVRILCDFLSIHSFLLKEGDEYSLSVDAATFLNRDSPAYFGNAIDFLLDTRLIAPYLDLAKIVRTGRTTLPDQGTVSRTIQSG